MDITDLARQLADQQSLTLLVAGMLGIAALYLSLAPISECDRCAHCRTERAKRDEADSRRLFGISSDTADPDCPLHRIPRSTCQKQHEDD